MKFLCVPCDKPMKLEETSADRGSFSLVYSCPDCGYECAMLTNPMESGVVASLGVKIGESKCPFTGMVQEAAGEPATKPDGVPWTPEAESRMTGVPEFVRPMVRTGIERFARENGHAEVDEKVLDQAKSFFGM
jgi:hypothetical protein